MIPRVDAFVAELPVELARAREALATVATWGQGFGNGIWWTAVGAFNVIEETAEYGLPSPAVPDDDPGLTAAEVSQILTAAHQDIDTVANTGISHLAIPAARAARILSKADVPAN